MTIQRLTKWICYQLTLVSLVSVMLWSNFLAADEIIISGNEHAVPVGDFDFYLSNSESDVASSTSMLTIDSQGEVIAGELWKFFDSKGINSVENLTVCMDWNTGQYGNNIDIAEFRLIIEDPDQAGVMLTDVSLGNDSIIVPNFEVSNLKPEARLGVALGYDFMKRFSSNSQEKIKLDFGFGQVSQAGFQPTVSFEGSATTPPSSHWLRVLVFVTFCVVAFKCLDSFTKPGSAEIAGLSEAAHS